MSFLAQFALRVEVADSAALAAGGWVDRCVDESWLARIHRRISGALQFVGGGRVDADAAECFHHPVVA